MVTLHHWIVRTKSGARAMELCDDPYPLAAEDADEIQSLYLVPTTAEAAERTPEIHVLGVPCSYRRQMTADAASGEITRCRSVLKLKVPCYLIVEPSGVITLTTSADY